MARLIQLGGYRGIHRPSTPLDCPMQAKAAAAGEGEAAVAAELISGLHLWTLLETHLVGMPLLFEARAPCRSILHPQRTSTHRRVNISARLPPARQAAAAAESARWSRRWYGPWPRNLIKVDSCSWIDSSDPMEHRRLVGTGGRPDRIAVLCRPSNTSSSAGLRLSSARTGCPLFSYSRMAGPRRSRARPIGCLGTGSSTATTPAATLLAQPASLSTYSEKDLVLRRLSTADTRRQSL